MKKLVVLSLFSLGLFAGPPILCRAVPSGEGSLFTKLESLRMVALSADDSPESEKAALAKLKELRAAAHKSTDDLIAAGYLTEGLRQMRRSQEADGVDLLKKALAQRPGDADLTLLIALAYAPYNPTVAAEYYGRAKELAKSNASSMKSVESTQEYFAANRRPTH